MAEDNPNPDPRPAPRSAAVTCPSCGSAYNTETHELITDSGMPTRIRELETERDVWQQKATELQAKLDVVPVPDPEPPPEPKKKTKSDFFVA